ncbi:Phenyloxazoline synthase MbtB [Serratia marcescens]|uniref:thioesterase II family protein n=1 Tax=Serratia marcescens TaxID=615 RepID=UPI00217BBA6D|nr:alpha/beta fold hydrolase [Serratia marcescens]CAI1667164.1 Phenyloxazoline synthase MbtB [Serratia marcescens]
MTQLRTSLGCAVRLSRPRSSPVTKQLVVFPHAGGGVAFYQHWRELLPDEVDLFIMQYPGREEAQSAPAWETAQYAIARCVDALHASLGIAPAVIFGHSMGTLLALQVAAALQTSRFRIDTVLSAQRAPSELKLLQQESQRQEVLDHILAFSESSGALTLDALTRPLVTRLIQQDLRLLGELSAEPLPGLQPRIWGGDDDPLVSRSALSQWKKELPGSQVQLLTGDHFYFMQDTAAFLRRLLQ